MYVAATQMPAHFNYLVAASFFILGPSTAAIRLVTAAFGVAAVVFAYLLFRRWLGERWGFVAAALLAVMRYHLTVSRFGMQAVTTPAFEFACLYWLDRAVAHRDPRDAGWLGLTLGLGMGFYYALRLFPLVLAGFSVAWFISAARARGRSAAARPDHAGWRRVAAQLALGSVAFVVTSAPVWQFALQHPDEFSERTSTVSIFQRRDEPDLLKALSSNVGKHLAMFNLRGDSNGRHNLPGEPMLDSLTATLFVFGIVLALRRRRDPPNTLMLLLFFTMNLGGILSLDFEAPQSLRSVGVIPALPYFAVLPLAAIGAEIGRAWPVESRRGQFVARLAGAGLGLLIVAIAYANFATFFSVQRLATSSWQQYSTVQTIAAREMNRLAPTHDLIVAPELDGHPTVQFLAPTVAAQRWTGRDPAHWRRLAQRGDPVRRLPGRRLQ